MPQFNSVAELLAHIAIDDSEWSHRDVKLVFNQNSEAWVLLIPQGDHTLCIDFAYQYEVSPETALEGFFAIHGECEIVDWSPGRLACILVDGSNLDLLAEIINDVVKMVFRLDPFTFETFYQEMGRA